MILASFKKQPAEVKDYDIDYSAWLQAASDSISDVTISVTCVTDASDTALSVSGISHTQTRIKVWITGGTASYKYKVTILVATTGGRQDEVELLFKVRDD